MPAHGLALAVVVGVCLGFFGGGGSILTVPLLVYVFGLDAKQAIASSLLIVAAASVSGAYHHWRVGNLQLRTGLLFGAAGMAGAYAGGIAGAFLDGSLLLLLFAAMMVLTSFAMWRGRRIAAAAAPREPATLRLLAQGCGVGLFTGLVGAGGGFLIVPALVLFAGLPLPAAIGTSLFVIVLNTLAGFSGYASHTRVDAGLVAALGACAIAGSVVGARLTRRIDPAALRRVFAVFVLAMASLILVREADSWLSTLSAAVPASAPQLVFALFVLGVGVLAGRATRRAGADPFAETGYDQGGGI